MSALTSGGGQSEFRISHLLLVVYIENNLIERRRKLAQMIRNIERFLTDTPRDMEKHHESPLCNTLITHGQLKFKLNEKQQLSNLNIAECLNLNLSSSYATIP